MLTLTSLLQRTVKLFGNDFAIFDGDVSYTWSQLNERVEKAVSILSSHGVKRGDRFSIVCRNSFRQYELIQAGFQLGAVPVPVNYRLAAAEINFILDDSDSKLLIVEDMFCNLFEDGEISHWKEKALCISSESKEMGIPDYEELLLSANPIETEEINENDDALLLYTGGTTGRSKGVRLTNRNIVCNALQIAQAMRPRGNDVYMHIAPMFHAADLVGTAYTMSGAAHVYMAQPSAQSILQAIKKYNVTATMIPPTLVIMVLEDPDFDSFDLSNFRQFVFGSAPMTPKWIFHSLEKFSHTDIWHGYGLTETSPMLTLSKLERSDKENLERLKSAGQPVVATDLRIVNDQGEDVAFGEVGEVVVRGPQIAKGYLNLPDETNKVFKDGWFYTGDVGRIDEQQYLYLLDRIKDMVITGGENVYTGEVEAALCTHPLIREAAVFGVPNELYGEALVASIVLIDGKELSPSDVVEYCRESIGGYKIPRKISIIDSLPKNTVGKVLKNELRESYISLAETD